MERVTGGSKNFFLLLRTEKKHDQCSQGNKATMEATRNKGGKEGGGRRGVIISSRQAFMMQSWLKHRSITKLKGFTILFNTIEK